VNSHLKSLDLVTEVPKGTWFANKAGAVFHGIGASLADKGLEDLGEWLWEPVFWYGIIAPVALLVILTIYLFWLDRKAGKLYRLDARRKSRLPPSKAPRKKVR
jgi:hypothetical protein